ncbi:tRNA pseudouridine(38-40) synthase TruA [bacterium]|nr:tRNA pseudouridine(38-40) synthase TruA [candidate division CSSED10-310 bacterium]
MRNVKLVFEYDGTRFWGYQRQAAGRTVQGEMERILSILTNAAVTLNSAGRTDSGVHATGQAANFKTGSRLTDEQLLNGLHALLPSDIAIRRVETVDMVFHARFSAVARRYEYRIRNADRKSVFHRLYELHVTDQLDAQNMDLGCRCLIGEHDFSSFRAAGDTSAHSKRNMMEAGCCRDGEVILLFFEANAFLQHMIRIIVGTLLPVGRGRMTVAEFLDVLQARDRARAGTTAPPHGLCLTAVRYE